MKETIAVRDGEKDMVSHSKKSAQWLNRASASFCIHFVLNMSLQFAAFIAFTMILTLSGNDIRDPVKLQETVFSGRNLCILLLLSAFPANIAASVTGLAFAGKLKGSLKGMFSRPDISLKTFIMAIPVTMCIQMLAVLFSSLFESVSGSSGMENTAVPQISDDMVNNILVIMYVVILGPLTEELLLRGMALKCSNYAGGRIAYVFSAFAFGMFHGNIIQGMLGFLLGLFFAWIDIKANSILPSVFLHIWNNGVSVVMDLIDSRTGISDTAFYIYMAAAIAAGVVCFVFIRKDLVSAQYPSSGFYACEVMDISPDEKKKCGFPALLRSPFFYIFTVIYIIMIIYNMIKL